MMASSSSLLCLSLMTVAVFLLPATDASFLPISNVQGLFVNGTFNCPSGGPLAGVTVTLNCKNLLVATVVGQNITDANGNFNITVLASSLGPLVLLSPSLACVATVQLPLPPAVCPVLSTTSGTIFGLLRIVGTIPSSDLGLLQVLQVVATITLGS